LVRPYLRNIDLTFDEDNSIIKKAGSANPEEISRYRIDPVMNVAIINLTGGGLSYGYINYLSEVLPRMLRYRQIKQLYAFVPPGSSPYFTDILPAEYLLQCEDGLAGLRQLRREIHRVSPDVVFFPSNRWLDLGRIPSVSMVQSMLPMVMPFGGNGWRDIMKNLVRLLYTWRASKRANRVIAVSNFVQKFLVDTWHISPERINVIYHGVNPALAAAAQRMPNGIPGDWAGRFLFTAGSMHPYRGLDDVIKAMAILASQGVRPPLVIAGGADHTQLPYLKRMQNLAEKLGVQAQIAWVGQLNAAEMAWGYHHCQLFLMTSRVEACPNIALEAMSHGAFCLAADNPPLPEFFQEAAIYYRPRCGEALAQAITTAWAQSPERAASLRMQASQRARDFTWEKTTALTVLELELATQYPLMIS
jgi:glycosyltransferase involved in cell wall biosynthesis